MQIAYSISLADFRRNHKLQYLKVNNINWEYLSCGKGVSTLLIFPGGLQNAESCLDMVNAFENDFKIIVVTVAGIKTIDEFCLGINTILDKENVKIVNIFGRSLGGLMAQSYLRRNKNRVSKVILSHTASPTSPTFIRKVVKPAIMQKALVKYTPISIIRFVVHNFGIKNQLGNNEITTPTWEMMSHNHRTLRQEFYTEFVKKLLKKELLQSTFNLTLDYYKNEKFSPDDLKEWKGKVLITRTENDPLMQDDGEFKKLYPKAQVYTFFKTGHLSDFLQFEKMIEVVQKFLVF